MGVITSKYIFDENESQKGREWRGSCPRADSSSKVEVDYDEDLVSRACAIGAQRCHHIPSDEALHEAVGFCATHATNMLCSCLQALEGASS